MILTDIANDCLQFPCFLSIILLLSSQVVLLNKVAQIPKGELLSECREATGIDGERARKGIEIHRMNDAAKGVLSNDAELDKHFGNELRTVVALALLMWDAKGGKEKSLIA